MARTSANRAVTVSHDIPQNDAPIYLQEGPFIFTLQGMAPPEKIPPVEEWGAAIQRVSVAARGMAFIIGDWCRYGEDRYGEKAAQYVDVRQWTKKTIDIYRKLSEHVKPSVRRMDRLSASHHLQVQKMSEAKQRSWLTKASADDEAEPWTVKELREKIRETLDAEAVGWSVSIPLPNGKAHAAFVRTMERKHYKVTSHIRYQYSDKKDD